jgi:hypothetical protein
MYSYQKLLIFLVILIVASTMLLPHRSVNLESSNFELESEPFMQYGKQDLLENEHREFLHGQ